MQMTSHSEFNLKHIQVKRKKPYIGLKAQSCFIDKKKLLLLKNQVPESV